MEDLPYPVPSPFNAVVYPLLGSYFYDELLKEVDSSKLFIYTIQYQWKWNIHERFSKVQQLGLAVIKAKSRNVDIKVILNQENPMRNLTKINSVTGDALARAGCSVKPLRAAGLLHTKLWIIDGVTVFIGSHNISGRSLSVNEEASVKIVDNNFARFMIRYFNTLWET